jgi:hypothetical protein
MDIMTILLASNSFLLLVLLILTVLRIPASPKHSEKRVKTDLRRIKDQINGKKHPNQL